MISFKGSHFPKEVILMSIRWYTAYSLSYRDVEELLEERGIALDHATVNRWVIKYAPLLESEFRKKKRATGNSWRMDETYIKIKGQWCYYYRAVDTDNNTIDFYLSANRDTVAALAFFAKAINSSSIPDKVNIDKSGANLAALELVNKLLPEEQKITIRQVKYLNNIIEQDHRPIKRITRAMLGFKALLSAAATLAGIELHRMLRKGQYILNTEIPAWQQFYALAE
jgi:putative transposase